MSDKTPTKSLVFETPDLIDMRAFSLFGASSKPRSGDPIGQFGTGLKYAVAIMCRRGYPPVLRRGTDVYRFYAKDEDFRGETFPVVRAQLSRPTLLRPRSLPLGFTTGLGRNWKPWQAYRELEANTRDEGGRTYFVPADPIDAVLDDGEFFACHDRTRIIVTDPDVIAAHEHRDEIFLPPDLPRRRSPDETSLIVYDRPSSHLYYRGLRAYDLPEPSLYTYDIRAAQELTEDRTLMYPHTARNLLAAHVAATNDEKMIEQILVPNPAEKEHRRWERDLDFGSVYDGPGATYCRVVERRAAEVSRSAYSYYGTHMMRTKPNSPEAPTLVQLHPFPWRSDDFYIYDARGDRVLLSSGAINPTLLGAVVYWANAANGFEPERPADEPPVLTDGSEEESVASTPLASHPETQEDLAVF
jgi:hypothetical protein